MSLHFNRALVVGVLLMAAITSAMGQTSVLYLSDETSTTTWMVQGGVLIGQFNRQSARTSALAVSLDIRTYPSAQQYSPGHGYDLAGSFNGGTYPWSGGESPRDGTTDGIAHNFAVGAGDGWLWRFDRNWQSGAQFATVGAGRVGIGFDTSDDSFWCCSGAASRVYHHSATGSLLSQFNIGASTYNALAFDNADGTIWVAKYQSNPVILKQFDRSGTLLHQYSVSISNGYGGGVIGAEFPVPPGSTWYRDSDGDGYGNAGNSVIAHQQPNGYVAVAGDCNDSNSSVNPGAAETCNGVDDNCDGNIDEGVGSTWYRDADSDGYGDASHSTVACSQPNGYVAVAGDCNDADSSVNPGAAETCNGVDDDCDGSIDEGVGSTWYFDGDSDGYGDAGHTTVACSQPDGYAAQAGDCDDGDPAVNPGASETCNGIDDNCDGNTDEGVGSTWYADTDSDGYGDAGNSTVACSQPDGYVADASDCDDTDAAVHPGAAETCNGVDDNCDGNTDEGVGSTWYADTDDDGFGDDSSTQQACDQPSGYVSQGGDCDDSDPNVFPGAPERLNGKDDNCDGQTDEGFGPLFVVFSRTQKVPGIAGTVRDEDIVRYDPASGAWSMYFDGSDVGLAAMGIDAMALLPGPQNEILMSFKKAGSVAGLAGGPSGTSVGSEDIVKFTPTHLGTLTQGTFSFYFDGSDVSLDHPNPENIDALEAMPDGSLLISLAGAGKVTGIAGRVQDEDLLRFVPGSLGAGTSGTWSYFFDGSDVGLADAPTEDVTGAALLDDGSLVLATMGAYSVPGGLSGGNADLLHFSGTFGAATSGSYSRYGSVAGLGGLVLNSNISAIDIVAPDGRPGDGGQCPADLTGDGTLDLFDLLAFERLFAGGDASADFNGDGVLDAMDFVAYQQAFINGC